MHKKTSSLLSYLLMIGLLITLLTGCQTPNSTTAVPTKTIVDCLNREVVIPADPQRVACLYASTAHIMAMLGQEDKIVGIPNGIKRDVLMTYKRPDIVSVSVPFNDGAINIEELLATNTDLVLLRQSTADNAGEIEKLSKAGIPWVVIDYASLDGLQKAITVTGQVFNQDERAAGYNATLQQTLTLVSQRVSGLPDSTRPRVYHAVNEAARTDLDGDLCSQITDAAGIINVSTQGGSLITDAEKTMTTLEQIYSWNPDAIIANDINATNYMLTDPKWSGLKAVAEQRVTTLPVGVTRWGHPGSIEPHMATLFIAKTFYPDLFSDVDLTHTVKDYYKQWFELDLTNADVAAILSGEGMRLAK
ncbi:ABC transporter substrate-binding protein [Acetobacterium sp. KB-1]|jgi:iron complex transport system substrate-binding protein|uniref:ABC transporter substrate-binding protein n=1 Tax=Acetobacterium TaxID=33951 RepID=UPI000DBEAEBA|nr:ABC transporter substrate-binding protein [Acetobacterium sp. KB-1]AWW28338.1 iron ABC transporter substrate-binding protein [Acetobacterium sp. KB-1]